MRFDFTIFSAILIATQVYALSTVERNNTLQTRTCSDTSVAVPLFRAYSAAVVDHLYTTSANEIQSVVNAGTYVSEGTVAKVFPTWEVGTVPLYRFYNQAFTDHFYYAGPSEGLNAGYTLEGVTGYVYPGTGCGGVPFYRLYLPTPKFDHLYTTQSGEVTSAETGGYRFEGVAAYVIFI